MVNNLRIIALCGEPASGKSTIMRIVIGKVYGKKEFCYDKLVRGYFSNDFLDGATMYILGLYGQRESFPGTDRLSMSVQPSFSRFIGALSRYKKPSVVVFEGDRLCNKKTFEEACRLGAKVDLFVLSSCEEAIKERHKIRRDSQSQVFVSSVRKKISNLIAYLDSANGVCLHFVENNNEDDIEAISDKILREIRGRLENGK